MRSCDPTRWSPPVTTHDTPRSRAMSRAGSSTRPSDVSPVLRGASGETTERPGNFLRSAVIVSAKPLPNRSSPGSSEMFEKGTTNTVRGRSVGDCPSDCPDTAAAVTDASRPNTQPSVHPGTRLS